MRQGMGDIIRGVGRSVKGSTMEREQRHVRAATARTEASTLLRDVFLKVHNASNG